jgi:hypothetical protein
VIVQLPGATKLAVVPATVQTLAGAAVKATVRPELALALKVSGVPIVCAAIDAKLIVCDCCAALTVSTIGVEALSVPDVPVTVTVAVPAGAAAVAASVSVLLDVELAGVNVAVTPVGRPLAAKLTEPLKPLAPVTVTASLPLWP